ncbi:MAG: hypothetical protein KBA67_07885 [Leptotrichiaceae bacterium]|nr:hypothetical protein [Leptotrichiaceae bacterium]
MDTIQIALKLSKSILNEISYGDLNDLRGYIENIKSPKGYRYCDCLEVSRAGNIVVKISYPRYYRGINAFLISNNRECMKVQKSFCEEILNHSLLFDAEVILNRVDIPFTFMMDPGYDFNSYKKIYQIFNYIYRRKNINAKPKAFAKIQKFVIETLIFTDTSNTSAYNSKIMIYNQHENIRSKTNCEIDFEIIEKEYPDLFRRMRIEVSKRVQRKEFSIDEFSKFNIFREYSERYKKYLLKNIFDLDEIEDFYDEQAQELADIFLDYREGVSNFIYENFIYKEMENIFDYEIIRRALKICIETRKTREKAITSIRKVLREYERDKNIIVMNVYDTILEIREEIEQYFLD